MIRNLEKIIEAINNYDVYMQAQQQMQVQKIPRTTIELMYKLRKELQIIMMTELSKREQYPRWI